jgi:tetratricopeptide (TPR) repeat protein
MAQRTAGDVRLSDTVQTEIAARTDGVPLYIEELTHAILALRFANSGLPANDDDVVHIPSDIPATLHDLLRSQLDRLGEGGEVARIGAVIGRTFDRELLGRIVGLPESELDGSLDRLAASGLVFATDASNQRYVFKHALVQDAAYQGLTTRRRQRLHAQIAAALESAAISGHPPDPEVLAHHFEAAGELEKAFVQWRQAGANAAARYAHAEAVAQFRRAQALLGPAPEDDARQRREAELLRQLGPSMIASLGDGHPAVQATYARFETLCNAVGDDGLHCDALFGLSQCAQVCEPVDRSLVISKRYVEVARRVDDGQQLAIAHWILAQDYWRAGRFAEGRAEARRGRKAFDTTKPTGNLLEHPEILNRTVEDYCASMLGDTGAAIADLRRMADEAATAANPLSPKRTLTVLGVTLQFLGLLDETATVVRKMTELSTARGWRDDGDWSALLRAWVLTGTGDTAAAIDQAQRSVDAIARKSRRSRRLSILADTLAKSGRIESAQALIARALQEGEALGERFWEAELMRQRGELALTQGDTDRAAADFELSLAVARSQGSLLFALKTAVSLGGLRHRQRRGGEAAALVAPILQRFTDTFDFPARREARRLCSVKRTR